MGRKYGYRRFVFIVLAIACAMCAVFLPEERSDGASLHEASGVYRSELLDNEVSVSALSALTFTEEFKSLVDGEVRVEPVPESPYHIRVATSVDSEDQLLVAHKRSVHLLSVELKEQALGDVRSSLRYLDEVRRKAGELKNQRLRDETRVDSTSKRPQEDVLDSKDSQRVVFLREQIAKLEEYLAGGALPKAVRVRLDRESLSAVEERVRSQEQELRRLAKVFHPSSKAVQAQRVSVEEAQADLESVEKQMAEIYLRSLRLELETLDDKASSRIRDSLSNRAAEAVADTAEPSAAASSAWLDERQKELEKRAKVVTSSASLKLEGKLTFVERRVSPYGLAALGWCASLLFFLAALFLPASDPDPEESEYFNSKARPRVQERRLAPNLKLELGAAKRELFPDKMERFFEEISRELEESLGRTPRRLLVLGDTIVDTRLAFSIRLANSLAATVERVRLIDFDFQDKSLSGRLGREELPGVSELMLQGGPVEEFFSSISGTRIQFAPAGKFSAIAESVQPERISQILGTAPGEITIVDASSASPLHLLVNQVDAVLWTTRGANLTFRSEREREVILALRQAGLPVWGVSTETAEIFPLL